MSDKEDYVSDFDLWLDYLVTINMMASNPGMYTLDIQRRERHEKLWEYYSNDYYRFTPLKNRFNLICHNLDKACGFEPPLERYDSTKAYCRDMCEIMRSTECKYFLKGVTYILHSKYGEIKDMEARS